MDDAFLRLDELAGDLRSSLDSGSITDAQARAQLADATFRANIVVIAMRRLTVGADIWSEVLSRATTALTVKIMDPQSFDFDRRRPDGSPVSFASFIFNAAGYAVRQAVRDERSQRGRFPVSEDIPDVEAEPEAVAKDYPVLERLEDLSFSRMRGTKRTHVGALALRVAFGLPDILRPADARARQDLLRSLTPGAALSTVLALLAGDDVDPLLALPWAHYDADALRIVNELGSESAHALAASAAEDLPRPPQRPMRRFVRDVIRAGDGPAWEEFAAELAEEFMLAECDSDECDAARLDTLVREASNWPGAPLGDSRVVVWGRLRSILLTHVPMPGRSDIETEGVKA